MIVVVMGLSGSGKSFIANILHTEFSFEWLRSDIIRKELAGIKPEEHVITGFGEDIYSEEWTRRVYEEMVRRAQEFEAEGKNVVLDATFLKNWQRNLVKRKFPYAVFLLAKASQEEIRRRLSDRKDVSDANWNIYLKQKDIFEPPDDAIEIDTERSRQEVKDELRRVLSLSSP
ncbi:MAG: AAA family ATPase [Aquificaceae bacterium]